MAFYKITKKKQNIKHLNFRCGKTHLNYSSKILSKTFKLLKELTKTEMNHDGVSSDTWRDKKSEKIDYVRKDVLCTAFSNAR